MSAVSVSPPQAAAQLPEALHALTLQQKEEAVENKQNEGTTEKVSGRRGESAE
jgi:hypothetical protein